LQNPAQRSTHMRRAALRSGFYFHNNASLKFHSFTIALPIEMKHFLTRYFPLFPIIGMVIYVIVFSIAALDYPGGSYNLPQYDGHSYFHNFLCDTMLPLTPGGELNLARPLAIMAHLILSAVMISFFYFLPEIFDRKNRNTKLMRVLGMLTMTVFIFMYTEYHDLIVVLTGILGSLALIPFFIELRKFTHRGLTFIAILCYLMSIVVFFIFVTKIGYYYLPMLQKITFVVDAFWVIWVCWFVYQKRIRRGQPLAL